MRKRPQDYRQKKTTWLKREDEKRAFSKRIPREKLREYYRWLDSVNYKLEQLVYAEKETR